MRGPIRAPILLPFGNRNTPAEPQRAVPWAAKPGHACDDVQRQTLPTRPAVPYLPHQPVSRQISPSQPCLPCRASPYRARPPLLATPVQATPSLPADPCLPDHACRSLQFLDRSWPRHSVPANPAVQRHPFHACQSQPDPATPCLTCRSWPSAPSDACHTGPDPATTALPAMPPWRRPTRPCLPCLALARPLLAGRALPRSASPTSPNQQSQASASTGGHALPRPCLRSHACHACQARPDQLSPSPSKPCLPRPPGLAVPT